MSEIQDDTLALLAATAERTFDELCSKEVIDAAENGTWPAALWNTIEQLGFTRAALPEKANGSGLTLASALTLARPAGSFALPVPLCETQFAAWLLDQAGHPVPDGPLSFGPVDRRNAASLTAHADGWILHGRIHGLPWGSYAQRLALVLPSERGTMVASVDPKLATSSDKRNLAGEPRTTFDFDHVKLSNSDVRTLPQTLPKNVAYVCGALLRTLQISGALARARDLAIRYTADRIAFGKPLNKLQAVQQNLAVLAGQAAAAIVASDMVLDALADADMNNLTISVALGKARAGEAAGIGAALAHQLHGAIGFTHEHRLHHFTRRLWSWRDEFGNESYWAAQAGEHIVARGAEGLWAYITQAARL